MRVYLQLVTSCFFFHLFQTHTNCGYSSHVSHAKNGYTERATIITLCPCVRLLCTVSTFLSVTLQTHCLSCEWVSEWVSVCVLLTNCEITHCINRVTWSWPFFVATLLCFLLLLLTHLLFVSGLRYRLIIHITNTRQTVCAVSTCCWCWWWNVPPVVLRKNTSTFIFTCNCSHGNETATAATRHMRCHLSLSLFLSERRFVFSLRLFFLFSGSFLHVRQKQEEERSRNTITSDSVSMAIIIIICCLQRAGE